MNRIIVVVDTHVVMMCNKQQPKAAPVILFTVRMTRLIGAIWFLFILFFACRRLLAGAYRQSWWFWFLFWTSMELYRTRRKIPVSSMEISQQHCCYSSRSSASLVSFIINNGFLDTQAMQFFFFCSYAWMLGVEPAVQETIGGLLIVTWEWYVMRLSNYIEKYERNIFSIYRTYSGRTRNDRASISIGAGHPRRDGHRRSLQNYTARFSGEAILRLSVQMQRQITRELWETHEGLPEPNHFASERIYREYAQHASYGISDSNAVLHVCGKWKIDDYLKYNKHSNT